MREPHRTRELGVIDVCVPLHHPQRGPSADRLHRSEREAVRDGKEVSPARSRALGLACGRMPGELFHRFLRGQQLAEQNPSHLPQPCEIGRHCLEPIDERVQAFQSSQEVRPLGVADRHI